MRTLTILALPALLLLTAPAAFAESSPQTSEVEPGEINAAIVVQKLPAMPARGATMAGVRADLGAPRAIRDAVGEPPITRWVYDDFIVYFENDRVLHSVVPREP